MLRKIGNRTPSTWGLSPESQIPIINSGTRRGLPLPEKARQIILSAVKSWDASLDRLKTRDFESIAQAALTLLSESDAARNTSRRYRCVLVDEVQDLSQIEMRILASICDKRSQRVVDLIDGMFLVGDGAQTIYRRGFTFNLRGVCDPVQQ